MLCALDSQDLYGLQLMSPGLLAGCLCQCLCPFALPAPLAAPLPGVDVPDVLQSPSASLNKITARHVMNCCHFCLRQAALLSGKHLTSAGQQLSLNYPHQLAAQTGSNKQKKYTK